MSIPAIEHCAFLESFCLDFPVFGSDGTRERYEALFGVPWCKMKYLQLGRVKIFWVAWIVQIESG